MPEVDTIVIIGNGPSMRGVDFSIFDGVHTFGMKHAFRFFRQINWWPTYYGCFDHLSLEERVKSYQELVNDPEVTVQTFFFLRPICSSPRLRHIRFIRAKLYSFGKTFAEFGDGGNTAVNCAQVAVCLGYRRILLIGIDCNWENVPKGAEGRYSIPGDVASRDYFFDGYKLDGEVFHAPRPQIYHFPAWQKFGEFARKEGIEVVNCSPISKLAYFRKSTLEAELLPINRSSSES